jgi:predicted small lipoprotein YifL
VRWTILWLLTTLAATCGQKGPLYLPEEGGNPEQGVLKTQSHKSAARL